MIIHDVVQGTYDWMTARLGIPTASQFDRILTPRTRKPAEGRQTYRAELMAEWVLGQPLEWGSNGWVDRGAWLEAEARGFYEVREDVDVETVGFLTTDDGLIGCSPDGFVGSDGGVEIKVLGAAAHMKHLLGEPHGHIGQCQGALWMSGRAWWDLVLYNPSLPPKIIRIERDEEYISSLVPVLMEFASVLEADKCKLWQHRANGPAVEYSPMTDDEIERFQRELRDAEAADLIDRQFAVEMLSSVIGGRWREARSQLDRLRRIVLEGEKAPPRSRNLTLL